MVSSHPPRTPFCPSWTFIPVVTPSEARLGELIKIEQTAGRLSTGGRPKKNPYNDVSVFNFEVKNLSDYGLSEQDSYHAQALAEHKDDWASSFVRSKRKALWQRKVDQIKVTTLLLLKLLLTMD